MRFKWLLTLSVPILLLSCGESGITAKETYEYYAKANELFKKGDYSGAVEYFRKAEEGLPFLTTEQIMKLKYRIAMAYYKDENYADAILALEDYIDNFPTAPNIQEAYLYLIKSYLKIAPDAWRDPTYAEKAIKLADEFLLKFPNSPYTAEVEELKELAKKKIVKHYYLIAKFYEDYFLYYPAAVRFEFLLLNYPNDINRQDVLFHYIKNLYLTPEYAKEKIRYWAERYNELYEKLKKGEISEKKPAEKRLKFFLSQINRWKEISKKAVKIADENLELYKKLYGEDANYKLLLKVKEGKWKPSWKELLLSS